MLFFRFDASPKKLFVSYDYVLFFIWLPWHLRYHRVSNKLGGGGLNNERVNGKSNNYVFIVNVKKRI